ncbi:MAG TPA: carbonic anhydrase [Burkholderiaceae bacterium]|nr:carbonic anhydrase [Burkholderiaceae bacterium]
MRTSVATAFATAAGVSLGGADATAQAATPPKPQNVISPDEAVKRLVDGNKRYVTGVTRRHDFAHEREALNSGQNPYAAILSCADSRIAPEYAFDSARGDLFVTRVAGNFVNDDVLGSLEYAIAVLKAPLIMVLGHEGCGAVDAAVKVATQGATYPGMIQSLVAALVPSVDKVKGKAKNLVEAATEQNVRDSMVALSERSAIVHDAMGAGKLRIVGGIYRLATGKVDFLA